MATDQPAKPTDTPGASPASLEASPASTATPPEKHATASDPRPKSTRAQIIQATCAIFTAMAAVAAVGWYYISMQRERTRAAEEAIARIYPLTIELNRFLAERPDVRQCLAQDPNGELWKRLSPERREQFKSACSMVGSLFEYYLLIQDNIRGHPKGEQILAAWDAYIKEICISSYAFRGYIKATEGLWPDTFVEVFRTHAGKMDYAKDVFPN